MNFVDEAVIHVEAGRGGNGCVAFRREKFVPRGGPAGGDGGHGGSIYLHADGQLNTLQHLRFNPHYKAERGRHGEGSNRTGRCGEDSFVRLPLGTEVLDAESGELLGEMLGDGERLLIVNGGRGGRGNSRFTSATNQAPRRADPGEEGEARSLKLELKLLADVGVVGLPNAGKSTLISVVSAATPKIADYPEASRTTSDMRCTGNSVPSLRMFIASRRHRFIASICRLPNGRARSRAAKIRTSLPMSSSTVYP